MDDNVKIDFSKKAVIALDNLIIGMSNATGLLKEEGSTLYAWMSTVKESVGPFAEDYEKEIKKIITEETDLIKRLSNIAVHAREARDYIQGVLATRGGSGNP